MKRAEQRTLTAEQLGRDFRGNAAKAAVALGGVLRHSDQVTYDVAYCRLGIEDFVIVTTTRFSAEACNAVIAGVLGHHFLTHAPVMVAGGEHTVRCPSEAEGLAWGSRFLGSADSQQRSEAWLERAMRARRAPGEPR